MKPTSLQKNALTFLQCQQETNTYFKLELNQQSMDTCYFQPTVLPYTNRAIKGLYGNTFTIFN